MVAEKQAEILKQLQQGAGLEAVDNLDAAADRPCSIYALGAAGSGGFLGALYGFGEPFSHELNRSFGYSAPLHYSGTAGMKVVMHKGQGRLKAARTEAMSSAKVNIATFLVLYKTVLGHECMLGESLQAFAVFGGLYALANCIVQRLRQKEDGKPCIQGAESMLPDIQEPSKKGKRNETWPYMQQSQAEQLAQSLGLSWALEVCIQPKISFYCQ